MGVHLYDSSTYTTSEELARLRPALAVANANIPCLVWGEDALAFVHCVPTVLFQFHLIVPDDALEAACKAIMDSLPYKKLDAPHPTWQEYGMVDTSLPSCYPSSVCLECTGDTEEPIPFCADTSIAVHPQSFWSVDVRDTSRSVSLEPAPPHDQRIRLPTITAFLDSIITTVLEPPDGSQHLQFGINMRSWIAYLLTYTPQFRAYPSVLPDGSLEPGHAFILDKLSEENKPYFENIVRGKHDGGWMFQVQRRRDILERMGRFAEARRPMPEGISPRLRKQKRALHSSCHPDMIRGFPRMLTPKPSVQCRYMPVFRNLLRRLV